MSNSTSSDSSTGTPSLTVVAGKTTKISCPNCGAEITAEKTGTNRWVAKHDCTRRGVVEVFDGSTEALKTLLKKES